MAAIPEQAMHPMPAMQAQSVQPVQQVQHAPEFSLYVGDLDQSVNTSDLFEVFKECGKIKSIRVCYNLMTRRSLGYAYVNYESPDSVEKALTVLNHKPIKGRPCRVMRVQHDLRTRKNPEANLYVKYLKDTVTARQLEDVFSSYGAITSCKVALDEKNQSLGFGFVQFERTEDAQKALAAVDKQKASLGERLQVNKFIPAKDRPSTANDRYTNLYIKNIGKALTKEQLEELFKPFGTITSAVVVMDSEGKSRGFGFVNFSTHEEAEKAQKAMDRKEYKWLDEQLVGPLEEGDNKDQLKEKKITVMPLFVARAMKKQERYNMLRNEHNLRDGKPNMTNLHVRNLSEDITTADLEARFKQFGTIKRCTVMRDRKTGKSRGFGFVEFSTPEEANLAIQKANYQNFNGQTIVVALARSKEERMWMRDNHYFNPPPMYPYNPYTAMRWYPSPIPMQQAGYSQRPYPHPRKQQQRPRKEFPAGKPAVEPAMEPAVVPKVEDEREIKQQIGERIYAKMASIPGIAEDRWGKLTGMLLESLKLDDLQQLVKNSDELVKKIGQANEYYNAHLKEKQDAAAAAEAQ